MIHQRRVLLDRRFIEEFRGDAVVLEGGFLGEDDGLNPTIKYNFRTVEVKLAGSCFFEVACKK